MQKAIRVLVANRPRLMRELILTTFADQPDIEIVGEVGDESEISESVKRTLPNFVSLQSRRRRTPSFTTGLLSIFIPTILKLLKKEF